MKKLIGMLSLIAICFSVQSFSERPRDESILKSSPPDVSLVVNVSKIYAALDHEVPVISDNPLLHISRAENTVVRPSAYVQPTGNSPPNRQV